MVKYEHILNDDQKFILKKIRWSINSKKNRDRIKALIA